MTLRQADILEYYLLDVDNVTSVKVYDRTQDAIIHYRGDRSRVIRALSRFRFEAPEAIALVPDHTGRALNREYEDKLVMKVVRPVCLQALPAYADPKCNYGLQVFRVSL